MTDTQPIADSTGFAGSMLVGSIADALMASGRTVGTCESLTGGRIAAKLTRLAGASRWFCGGLIVYNAEVKIKVAGVDPNLIERYGVVSEEVAVAMAQGARVVLGTDYAIAVTGNAGPTAEEDGRPVGTVCLAACGPDGERARTHHLDGDRNTVQALTTRLGLHLLVALLEES